MAKVFSIDAERTSFRFARLTRVQIHELIQHLDRDATAVIERSIAELWQRELGQPDRDLAAEVDELKAKVKEQRRILAQHIALAEGHK